MIHRSSLFLLGLARLVGLVLVPGDDDVADQDDVGHDGRQGAGEGRIPWVRASATRFLRDMMRWGGEGSWLTLEDGVDAGVVGADGHGDHGEREGQQLEDDIPDIVRHCSERSDGRPVANHEAADLVGVPRGDVDLRWDGGPDVGLDARGWAGADVVVLFEDGLFRRDDSSRGHCGFGVDGAILCVRDGLGLEANWCERRCSERVALRLRLRWK